MSHPGLGLHKRFSWSIDWASQKNAKNADVSNHRFVDQYQAMDFTERMMTFYLDLFYYFH